MIGLFKTHGPVAFAILAAGLAAIVTGLLSVAAGKKRAAAKVGLVALGLVALTCSLTIVGVMRARIEADRAAEAIDEPVRTLVVQRGYEESADLSKLGVALGAAAFVAAIIGTMRGLSVKEGSTASARPSDSSREPELGELSDSTLGLGALVVGALAFFSIAASFMPLVMKPPGLDLAPDDPARKFRDAEAMLGEGRVEEACAALEEAYEKGADPKRAKIRSVEGLVTECFDKKLEHALSAGSLEEFESVVSSLEKTKMPLDEKQKKRLEEVVALRPKAP